MRQTDKEIRYLTQKELEKLFNQIEKSKYSEKFRLRDLTMFNIAYYCWLRAWEIWMIKLSDYNYESWELKIKRLKWSMTNTIRLDKKRKLLLDKYIKEFYVTDEKKTRLYNIKDEYDNIFKTKFWYSIDTRSVHQVFRKYISKTNIPNDKHHPHVLKHSIAVHLAESGLDVKDIQYWLWHKNINNTQIYFQYTTIQQELMYKKLGSSGRIV